MTELPPETTPDEICAFLTHELRSPLSTIAGYLDLLANGGVGPVTDEQREFLVVVSRNVQRLTGAVNDWYDMVRIEAGQLELAREPVDLEEVVDRAIAGVRPRIRSKEQQVTVETSAVPCIVLGDQRALVRVVHNLLSNAHKYTPTGGAIRLVLCVEDERIARLDVTDTGIGIRDEDQAYLFRKFYRAHLTDAEPGTGLGLPLTRALVERMGGRIDVQSVLGSGSTFSIRLPRRAEPNVPVTTPPPVDGAAIGDQAADPVASLPPTT
jgi:signal transduction histidine kinase